jgi:hypothetical protein
MEPGRRKRGRTAAALGVALLAFGAGVATTSAESTPADPEARVKAKVEIRSASQRKILRSGRVVAEVEAPAGARIRAQARIRRDRKGAKSALISNRRDSRFAAGTRRIELPLNKRGERRVARCDEQTLVVQVRFRNPRKRVRAKAPLKLDRKRCEAGESPGATNDFAVGPAAEARHANDTPRSYTASALGTEPVIFGAFACDNVDPGTGGSATFTGNRAAQPGDIAVGIGSIEGTDRPSRPRQVGPLPTGDGSVAFELNGNDDCAFPVVWRDADGDERLDIDPSGTPTESYGVGGSVAFEPQGVQLANVDRCDPLDTSDCLHPFPNDHFTAADSSTPTGRRVNFNVLSMPSNRAGVPVLPAEYNRADGFSPGSMLITRVDGIDSEQALEATGAVPIDDLGQWDDPDQPVVVIDAETGERHPVWAEIDSNPADPADRTLLIRPQRNFQ